MWECFLRRASTLEGRATRTFVPSGRWNSVLRLRLDGRPVEDWEREWEREADCEWEGVGFGGEGEGGWFGFSSMVGVVVSVSELMAKTIVGACRA